MPASFRILPERGLVYVQYSGFIRLADTQRLIQAYLAHPDRHPGQKQLVDLAAVTGFEQDFVGLMAVQAAKAAIFFAGSPSRISGRRAPSSSSSSSRP